MKNNQEILEHAIRIAKSAGYKIRNMREANTFTEQLKFGYELVTSADIAANDLITEEIHKAFPTHRFISEESANQSYLIDLPTWVIDPIDGTVGYANGHYQVAVSIAFGMDGQIQLGVVYNPFLDELFYAIKGEGAFLNNKRIFVKEVTDLKQCVIATGFPHKKEKQEMKKVAAQLAAILPEIRDVRRMGSAALDMCWVACGRIQGYYEGSLGAWDLAASKLIAKEAGAVAGHYGEKRNTDLPDDLYGGNLIVASPGIFDAMRSILDKS
jgi:myo-inositol-1(or 4)-monophosphatase